MSFGPKSEVIDEHQLNDGPHGIRYLPHHIPSVSPKGRSLGLRVMLAWWNLSLSLFKEVSSTILGLDEGPIRLWAYVNLEKRARGILGINTSLNSVFFISCGFTL